MSGTSETRAGDVQKMMTEAAQATIAATGRLAAPPAAQPAAASAAASAPAPAASAAQPAAAARATVESTAKAATTTTTTMMEKTMDQVNKATNGFFKATEEAAEFGRGNAEAVAKATEAYVSGVQDFGRQAMAAFQGMTDQVMDGAKALSGAKTFKEAAEVQATLARTAIERNFTEAAKLQEAALKLAEHAFAPLSARMTLAAERLARPAGV